MQQLVVHCKQLLIRMKLKFQVEGHSLNVASTFPAFFESDLFADFDIVVNESQPFAVHRLILASSSPVRILVYYLH